MPASQLQQFPQPTPRPRKRPTYPAVVAGLPHDARVRLVQIIGDANTDPPTPGLFPMSKSRLYELIRQGRFPAPAKLAPGSRASYWRFGDVLDAIQRLEDAAGSAHYETAIARKRRATAEEA